MLKPIKIETGIVYKTWGHELILVNNEDSNYCSKHLCIDSGSRLSLQFHAVKSETLILLSGECDLVYVDTIDGVEHTLEMKRMAPTEIPRLLPHSLRAITDCVILEVSNFHRDSDTYRIYK